MSLNAAIGIGSALDGKQAVTYAIHHALNEVQQRDISFALIIGSQDFDVNDVHSNAVSHLGNTPMLGFSTPRIITEEGEKLKTVVVVLFTGDGVEALTNWWSGFGENSSRVCDRMISSLDDESDGKIVLAIADGVMGDAEKLASRLASIENAATGWLSGGRQMSKETWQFGGSNAGINGLASAEISGMKIGVGLAHGWQNSGAVLRITLTRGAWIRAIDGAPASEMYSRLFGRQAVDWIVPPLNSMVRLYPFAIQDPDKPIPSVRSPLWIEPDGSLRMNTQIPDGSPVNLMIGSVEGCVEALKKVSEDAIRSLGVSKPAMGLLIADRGWEMLLRAHSINLIEEIKSRLEVDIPVIGAYTYGQIGPSTPDGPIEYLNQHVQLILFAGA